ncbi:MAG: ABC transporter ATP-binding protein [Candidatus Sumerlaeota bacterium]|nr:ABC transporter ATP-binding protein [Candidatus Sumerlaeota bacterium]
MRDPFLPELTKHFRVSMRAASLKDRERVRGKAMLRVIGRTFRYIFEYKWRVVFDLLLVMAGALLALLPPILVGQLFTDNILLRQEVDYSKFEKLWQAKAIYWVTKPWHTSGPAVLLIAMLICFLCVQGLLAIRTVFFTWWDWGVKNRVLQRLRTTLVGRFLRLGLRRQSSQRVGDIIWRVQSDADCIRQFYSRIIVEMWNAVIAVTINIYSLFMLNRAAATVALCIIPLAITLNLLLVLPVRFAARRSRETNSGLMSKIDATFGAIRTVIAFGRERRERAEYRDMSWETLRWEARHEVLRVALVQSVNFGLQFGHAALFFYGAYAVWKDWLTVGQWTVMYSCYAAVQTPVLTLSQIWSFLQSNLVGLDRVYTVLDQKPDIEDRPGAKPLDKVRVGLEFRNVSVEYEPGRRAVNKASLEAKLGTVTAIVGPVGAGKTTLVSCIPRFFDPSEGAVLIDGVDVRDLTVESLRSRVAVALQDNRLFSASILENLLYGMHDGAEESGPRPALALKDSLEVAPGSTEKAEPGGLRPEDLDETLRANLKKATQAAGLDKVIAEMPQKYETPVSEHASRLNFGEKQRIGVARAFLRNSPILVLDEPAASLDGAAAAELLRNVRELRKDRVVFIVARRLAAASIADQILFMEGGQILEAGRHEDLMKIESGYYRKFYEALYQAGATA